MKKIQIEMDIKSAEKLLQGLNVLLRIGLGQFDDFIDFLTEYLLTYDKKEIINSYLRNKIFPELAVGEYYSIHNNKTNEISKIACDLHDYIRREIAWDQAGKDYKKDERDWTFMTGRSYDDPAPWSNAQIETKIIGE